MEKRKNSWGVIFALLLLLTIFVVYGIYKMSLPHHTQQEFMSILNDPGQIVSLTIKQNSDIPTGSVTILLKGNKSFTVNVSDVNEVTALLDERNISYYLDDVSKPNYFLLIYLPVLLGMLFLTILVGSIFRGAPDSNGNGNMMNFGKSRARMTNPKDMKTTFKDVAGLYEEKEDLVQIVDFLSNPSKYEKIGARIPKGVILVGPPGNGKTLLAKAVAGEAGVPFFSISGSDFMEMFVGVGASRVRDMFAEAKAKAPCIIFIDEIDAIGRRRGTGMGGGHDEREQTLNQLLVEMDGFTPNSGIIVMAATNRQDILDPALLRPGRFDRMVTVGRPDIRSRLDILKVHAASKPLGDDVDLDRIAQTTPGFSGADLANLLNEAAILAATQNKEYITMANIEASFAKIGIGTEKRSRIISDEDKKITAFHEAGHAILFHILPDVGPVHTVSIIPTGNGAGGYTMPLPERDEMYETRGHMMQEIIVSMGGRVAEELVLDDITTGASEDIKQATQLARAMVTRFGMSESVGPIHLENSEEEVFIGRDLAHARSISEKTASEVDAEVKRIVTEAYASAKKIISENRDKLEACAAMLIEKEKINQSEFETIFA